MGRKVKVIHLTPAEQAKLENGYRQSNSASFARRCHIILLKAQGRSSQEIAQILGTTIQPVNDWVKRYEGQGIEGLKTKPGQGRKPIFNQETDETKVKQAVKKERQRLALVKEEIEKGLGKTFSHKTLRRFLKNLSADGNESV